MTIVEAAREIVGGVDTHLDAHVAAAVDTNGGVLGVASFAANRGGYRDLAGWLRGFGRVARVGVEGTGSYGAELTRYLRRQDLVVVEVDSPDRQARHRAGKSDPVDAVAAARAALSGKARGVPKSRDGQVEAMRALLVARRGAVDARIATLNQLRGLCATADDRIKQRFGPMSPVTVAKRAAALKPRPGDPVRYCTLIGIRTLGRRAEALRVEIGELDRLLRPLITDTAPGLLKLHGVGYETAAQLLVAAGDNPERLRSEAAWAHLCGVAPIPASSGKTVRHRLNRGGNREANSALYHVVLTRLSSHQPTKDYMARRLKEGKTNREVMRALKRYVAREVYRQLRPATITD